MSIKKIFLSAVCALIALTACNSDDRPVYPEPPVYDMSGFAKGADIGWLTEMEKEGSKFYDSSGRETECMALLRDLGMNSVRLRVWVDPEDGWCNKSDVLAKAWRAKNLGMRVMVNFHYSDWWADPGKQNIPAAWEGLSYEEMKTAVSDHTVEVLTALKENGIEPEWVQVGNETSNGFLWEMGQADKNPAQYAGLFAAGYEAAKSVFPDTKVIVHLDSGYDNDLYNWNLDILKNNGAKWDMIGMSLYPYWAMLYGEETSADKVITDCIENIKKVSAKYDSDVMIVETGMECADDDGRLADTSVLAEGKALLSRILKESQENTNGRCKGVFYWEPQCKPSKYRLGAFTEEGYPTVIMDAFQ